MPPAARRSVQQALRATGYSLFAEDYEFRLGVPQEEELAAAPLVAFWQQPFDQFSSAIAVRWTSVPSVNAEPHLLPIAEELWAPYTILAAPGGCAVWETLPTGQRAQDSRFQLLQDRVEYPYLPALLTTHKSELGPEAIAARKQRWRQMALYEVSPEPNAFLQWAYRPTRGRLARIFTDLLVSGGRLSAPTGHLDAPHLRWLLRPIGVRIAWDKRWLEPKSRTSGQDILQDALRYPTTLSSFDDLPRESALELAELVADKLGAIHLGAADGGLLSQLIQGRGLPHALQKQWRLFPTPPDVAWRMVQTLPLELLAEDKRHVWDGTCGSGTILVAALDRLRNLVPHRTGIDLRAYLTGSIAGNDLQPAMADATRIALDQALGAPAGPEWRITGGDVNRASTPYGMTGPTVIAGNPPFTAVGPAPDLALSVISRYLDLLAPGGQLAIIAPRTMLATSAAAATRRRLLEEIELHEIWEMPSRVFLRTDAEATVLLGRKRYPDESRLPSGVVTWRRLSRDRKQQALDTVSQEDWLEGPRYRIYPPLAARLASILDPLPRLAAFTPHDRRAQGIYPGPQAQEAGDVTATPEPGAEPYLAGRTDMAPFYIPWERSPRWIQASSPRIQKPRLEHIRLLRSHKVIVSRHATRRYAWRVRAAVDREGLLPSDQFIAVAPLPPVSLEFTAALFNSALANCWLRLNNPAFSLRLDEAVALPLPTDLGSSEVGQVESIARRLAEVRAALEHSRDARALHDQHDLEQGAAALTLELDRSIYDLYKIPTGVQAAIAEYFSWLGDARPGFDVPLVERPAVELLPPQEVFDESAGRRLNQLFAEREERPLSGKEARELSQLVDRWQRAHLLADLGGRSVLLAKTQAESAAPTGAR